MDKKPVFRKIIVAWYDSEIACIVIILIMLALILFGIAGISVAVSVPEYKEFILVPSTLTGLCSCQILATALRLMRLYSE